MACSLSFHAVSVLPEAESHSVLHPLSDVNTSPTWFGFMFLFSQPIAGYLSVSMDDAEESGGRRDESVTCKALKYFTGVRQSDSRGSSLRKC